MKSALFCGAAPLLAFALASPAMAAGKLSIGADIGITANEKASVSGFDIPLDGGQTYGLSVNYDLGGPFRLQGEARKITTEVAGIADADVTGYFANAIIDMNTDGKVQPLFGAGIGQAETTVSVFGSEASADGMAWQVFGGAGLKITDTLSAELVYRHIDLGSLDFGFGADVDASTDALTFGLRVKV